MQFGSNQFAGDFFIRRGGAKSMDDVDMKKRCAHGCKNVRRSISQARRGLAIHNSPFKLQVSRLKWFLRSVSSTCKGT